MRKRLLHVAVIMLFCYLTFLVGVGERSLVLKVAHQIILASVLGGWILSLWIRREPWPSTRLDGPVFALLATWVLATVFSYDPRVSLETCWTFFTQALLFYLFLDLIQQGHQRWVVEGLFLAGGVVVIVTVIEMLSWYFGLPLVPRFVQSWPQLHGLTLPPKIHIASMALGNANYLAAFCVPVVPIAWMWGHSSRSRDQQIALKALSVAIAVVVLLTQSRGGMIALVVIAGGLSLEWVLREETNVSAPPAIQHILQPQFILPGAAVIGVIGVLVVGWYIGRNPSRSDLARLDLWYSAIEMFRDRPLTGVGPHQFGIVRLQYNIWEESARFLTIPHAHNVIFHLLAEGGVLVFAAFTWLAIRLFKVWKDNLEVVNHKLRQRLLAIGVSFAAVAAYNMVDTFGRTVQLVPLLAIASIVMHVDFKHARIQNRRTSKIPLVLATGLLIVAQISFIPVHRGALAQQRTMLSLAQDKPMEALSEIQRAQQRDPWLEFYKLQEAYILGLLANQEPELYLESAIKAHEESLDIVPKWELGWHNLAGLYAQQKGYREAIDAELRALEMSNKNPDYHFRLGIYYEAIEENSLAKTSYIEALRLKPILASSESWISPIQQETLQDAPQILRGDDPESAFDVAVFAENLALAHQVASQYADRESITARAKALWLDGETICLRCYLARGNDDLLQAEIDLHRQQEDLYNAANSARTAIFLSEGSNSTAWYILARIREQQSADPDEVKNLLIRSVSIPGSYHGSFASTAYGTNGTLVALPQTEMPNLFPSTYQPWIELADLLIADEKYDDARHIYEIILDHAPYAVTVQKAISLFPGELNK